MSDNKKQIFVSENETTDEDQQHSMDMSTTATQLEQYKQENYELRRKYDTLKSIQEYAAVELETLQANHVEELERVRQHHSHEMDDLRKLFNEQRIQNGMHEDLRKGLEDEVERLRTVVRERDGDRLQIKRLLANEAMLEEMVQEHLKNLNESLATADKKQNKVDTENCRLRLELSSAEERVQCLEETVRAKREALEEKEELLDNLQEAFQELQTELMSMQASGSDTDPDQRNNKGNSLFAEVDDQRQKVINILDGQNRAMIRMKQVYRESESEIRRLKEENALMVKEIEKCQVIFLTADSRKEMGHTTRITDLQNTIDLWRNRAEFLENQLPESKVSIFEYFSRESEKLQGLLHQCQLEKCNLNQILYTTQKELAQWRFQCLKHKCILIDRESLLESNNITFEPRCAIPVDKSVSVSIANSQGATSSGTSNAASNSDSIVVTEVAGTVQVESIEIEDSVIQAEEEVDKKQQQDIEVKPKEEMLQRQMGSNNDVESREETVEVAASSVKLESPAEVVAERDKENSSAPVNIIQSAFKSILVTDKSALSFMDHNKKVRFDGAPPVQPIGASIIKVEGREPNSRAAGTTPGNIWNMNKSRFKVTQIIVKSKAPAKSKIVPPRSLVKDC